MTSVQRTAGLAQQVHMAIRRQIATGTVMPGERVVVERIADQLGVSPTPVREALNRLIQEGLVVIAAHGRFEIVHLTPEYVRDTFLVRGSLEGLAAELAVHRLSQAKLDDLRRILDDVDMALSVGNFDAYARADDHLHRCICDAASNHVLARELQPLHVHVDFIRAYSRRRIGDHVRRSHVEHRQIVEALASRDGEAARLAVETHIRRAGDRIAQLIDFEAPDSSGNDSAPATESSSTSHSSLT